MSHIKNFTEHTKVNENFSKRIRLEEKDLEALVTGKEIEIEGVKMILADFGFDRIINVLKKAQ